ncbi:hypothetical protein [Nevskia ramosa]|uniref:hypothetical protein n=1 Tax=Nevskia ramosa TaxID=64002 RepID=UPI0003B4D330|nr:hypothetical protein [Nevskia ramosa]
MSTDPALIRQLARLCHAASMRAVLIDVAAVLPLAAGFAVLSFSLAGWTPACALLIAATLALIASAIRHARRHDQGWVLRKLDAACPSFEDSSALALQPKLPSGPLAALQQARIRVRMAHLLVSAAPDLRASWPRRRLQGLWLIGLALIAFALLLPSLRAVLPASELSATSAQPLSGQGTQLAAIRLAITPPTYTELPSRKIDTLDAKLPAGSQVEWLLKLDRDADGVALSFHDGSRLDLARDGELWRGTRVIDSATLYRIELRGAAALADDRGYRLDVIADQPPAIVVREPAQTLTVIHAAQAEWHLSFEAKDDYGLGDAELSLSLAQGAGDQLKVTEQRIKLEGDGDGRSRRYRQRLDLAKLGYAQGDDLIVRLTVADRRQPEAQQSVSTSLILRWPADGGSLSEGMEGLVQKVAPAYFRSQRQIIIDSEALLAQHATLSPQRYARDADALGVDQKILRLRYGEFLGEEFENGAPHDDEHQPEKAAPDGLGHAEDVLAEFGHEHNESEAATLMDPETKRLLRDALNEMWQAELQLRQAKPGEALPYEYKALALIKQLQQAERIYLARSGLELPPFDATRRLSGEREGLSDRSRVLDPRSDDGSPLPALLRQLNGSARVDPAPLLAWVKAHPETPDPLGLLADADSLQRQPDCAPCRRALAARLWPLLPAPPAAVDARRLPDAAGQAWLDGLSGARR